MVKVRPLSLLVFLLALFFLKEEHDCFLDDIGPLGVDVSFSAVSQARLHLHFILDCL